MKLSVYLPCVNILSQFDSNSWASSSNNLKNITILLKNTWFKSFLCIIFFYCKPLIVLGDSSGYKSHSGRGAFSNFQAQWGDLSWKSDFQTIPCLCWHSDRPEGDVLRASCIMLFSLRKESTRPPQALSFTGWPTGEQCSQHNLTADVCPGTICTNVKMNSLHCPLLSGQNLGDECNYKYFGSNTN